MCKEDMPVKFFTIRGRPPMDIGLLLGRSTFVWEIRGERYPYDTAGEAKWFPVAFNKDWQFQEITPLEFVIKTGKAPWSYPLSKEDRVRYEERGRKANMEGQTESGRAQ